MVSTKANIIAQLQRDILFMQGIRPASNGIKPDLGLESINAAFPGGSFPLAAVHEFLCPDSEHEAATTGFISGIVSSLMKDSGTAIWISPARKIFPPALKSFGIAPDKVIFIDVHSGKDLLWVTEEALKCEGIAAVITEIKDISFTESRRLQLAVEQSRVTGFIIGNKSRKITVNACVSRWTISSARSSSDDGLPGIGFPRWNVSLLKIRNGRPGNWLVEWSGEKFQVIPDLVILPEEQKRKAG